MHEHCIVMPSVTGTVIMVLYCYNIIMEYYNIFSHAGPVGILILNQTKKSIQVFNINILPFTKY